MGDFNPRGTFSLDVSLFGSRVKDVQPADLPPGASPDEQNNWFQPGMVATRPPFTRVLANPIAGKPSILSCHEFRPLMGNYPTAFVDSNGAIWINDPANPSMSNQIGSTTPGCTIKWENFDSKLWMAPYSPSISKPFCSSPFVGAGIPIYYNGTLVQRVTTDPPGAGPSFTNQPTAPVALAGQSTSASLTVTAVIGAAPIQVNTPGGGTITVWTQLVYTCSSAPSAALVGSTISVTGLSGTGSAQANRSGPIIAVSGSTFTLGFGDETQINLTAQAGTGTVTGTTYMTRSGNMVTVWIGGSSLPSNFMDGFWASVLNADSSLINGPNWTITSQAQASTGIVTVKVSTQLTNLSAGTQLYLKPAAFAASITAWAVSGGGVATFTAANSFYVGENVTLGSFPISTFFNGQVVTVLSASATQFTCYWNPANVGSSTEAGTATDVTVFQPGYQTVYQVLSITATQTIFTYQGYNTNPLTSTFGGSVYQTWSPQLGTAENAAQIINTGIDANNGAYFQFWQLGPDTYIATGQGTISSPQTQIQGQIPAGIRAAVLLFQSTDGAITGCSPIEQVSVAGSANLLYASQIAIGPPGTQQRIIAFTPYQGQGWYYDTPDVVPNLYGQGPLISLGTIIPDNTTTSAYIDFGDPQLTSGTQIDAPGNNLFNQFVLPPALGVIEYNTRLGWWGTIDNITNMVNMGFDGGYFAPSGSLGVTQGTELVTGTEFQNAWNGAPISIGGVMYTIETVTSPTALVLTSNFLASSGTYPYTVFTEKGLAPPGWTGINSGLGPSIAASNGFSLAVQPGMNLSQGFYQNQLSAPIALPNETYLVRFLGQQAQGALSNGVTFTISSLSTGFTTSASVAVSSTSPQWYVVAMPLAMPAVIPSDMTFSMTSSHVGSGTIFYIDELSIIYATAPVESQIAYFSYAENPFGYDLITGQVVINAQQSIAAAAKQRGAGYLVGDLSLFKFQDNGQTEPSGWDVEEYATDCGASGPNAIDSTEDVMWWGGRYGARTFSGDPHVKKISQEVAPDWEQMNWAYQTLLWVRNDPVQRLVQFGLVQGTAVQPNATLTMSYRLNDDAYNVPDPIHTSAFSGKMICTDLGRKWSYWKPGMNMAAMCTRPAQSGGGLAREMVFAGSGYGNLYYLDVINYPPLYPLWARWKCVDDDYGYYKSWYTPYFFYDHGTEQNPVLDSYRKYFKFMGIHIYGVGQCVITPYADSLTNPWPSLTFPLSGVDPGFDIQMPINVRCDRMSPSIGCIPLLGASPALDPYAGAAYCLTHLIVSGMKDLVFPIRGSIL